MSASRKLHGLSELTKFKLLWRDDLTPAQREHWRLRLSSPDPQAALRAELKKDLGVNLKADKQLTVFRQWDESELQVVEAEQERAEMDERRIAQEHPDWTKDQVREDLLKRSYLRARASGDFKLGFAAMQQDKGFITAAQDERKLRILEEQAAKARAVINDPKLSAEEQRDRLRAILK